jgi:N-acylneuraminate cytidylyltransferase
MGKPIMAYSIEAAKASGLFDEIMVSTDDEEFADVARQYGASVPFFRSEATSNDYAGTADVLFEVLEEYKKRGIEFDNMCCLYSTAPFVTSERLSEAYKLLNKDIDASFTVVQYSYPIQRSLKKTPDGYIEMNFPQYMESRSQDLEPIYHDAGQFYFVKVQTFYQEKTLWCKRTAPLILSELEVQDLDTLTDWQLAELKFRLIRE